MRTSRPGRPGAGFSLFEVIVVMVLMGLAAALILPSFSGGLSSLELEAAARDLITHMRSVRSEAVARQQVHRVILISDEEFKGYRLTNAFEKELKNYALPSGAYFEFPEAESEYMVSFYPTGRSSGGRFSLRTERGKTLHVAVDPITGLAGLQRDEEGFE